MKLRSKIRKSIVVALASLILVSSVPSIVEAARFKDVGTKHWAYSYIERVAELGYMKGISSDEFSPEGILNFNQAISLLGRFTRPTNEEKRKANEEYGSVLKDLKVEDWAMEDMAVAMYKGIVSKEEMERIGKNKLINKPVTKVATSIYLVRAMGLAQKAEEGQEIPLTYKDTLDMSAMEIRYVSVLIDADVLDPKGDGDGYFRPKSDLSRSVMAKMLMASYDYLDENPTKPVEPPKPVEPEKPKEETEKKNGTVVNPVSYVDNIQFVIISEGDTGEQAYELKDNTEISLDGKSAKSTDLKKGQEVDLTIKKGTREIISLKATTVDMDISGKVKSINTSSSKLSVEHTVDKKTVSGEYPVGKDAYIYLNGKASNLKDLSVGDQVDLKIKKGIIEDIEAKSKLQKVEGIIKDLVEVKDSNGKEYNISIEDPKDKEKTYSFLINEDTVIYKNNKKTSEITDLKVKDEAYVEAEYGVAVEIDSNVVRKRVEGIIASLTTRLNQKPEITILNKETKKEEKYELGKTPFIRVDRKVTNTSELKVGYYVDLLIEGDEILELDADSRTSEATIMGTVTYVNPRNNEMEIFIESFDLNSGKYGDQMMVYLKESTVIVDRLFSPIRLDSIKRGDRLNVIGSYDGSSLIADTINLR